MLPSGIIVAAAVVLQQLALTPPVLSPPPIESGPHGLGRLHLHLHLLDETLRIPFGDDWGGETRIGLPLGGGLSVGLFVRAWAEAPCDRPDCPDRAVHAGADGKLQVTPTLDVGLDGGVHRSATQRTGPMILPRVRLKF